MAGARKADSFRIVGKAMTKLAAYILGLGSPTHPFHPQSYAAYTATYEWKKIYGRELLYSGPLFTHQLSHMWVDFRGIRDDFMRHHDNDYSRTAGRRRSCSRRMQSATR